MGLSLSCCLPTLPAPQKGSLCPMGNHLLWNSAQPAREIQMHDFLNQGREEKTRILIFYSSTKPHRSPFAFNSLNIPSKCWKLTRNCYYKTWSYAPPKKILSENAKEGCFFVCVLSPLSLSPAFLSLHAFYFQTWLGRPEELHAPQSHVFFKRRSLKGTIANGSVAWQGFNYLYAIHWRNSCWAFFLSSTPLPFVFSPF